MSIQFNDQQSDAIKKVQAWLKTKGKGKQVFRLFGAAGTGKSTVASACVEGLKVAFMAFTGKAAQVLQDKGCEGATTIHSAIYKVAVDQKTGKVSFYLDPDSMLRAYDVIVLDEVSMVSEQLGADLCSFGVPILVLGDPYQLPPLEGAGYFTAQKPDVLLTKVERHDGAILWLAHEVLAGRPLKVGKYDDCEVVLRTKLHRDAIGQADQVICGRNATRHNLNRRIRALKGLQGEVEWLPVPGDKMICGKNNRELGIYNGSLWELESVGENWADGIVSMKVESLDRPGWKVDVVTLEEFLDGTADKLDWKFKANYQDFQFGWCLTGHKSQGSTYGNVLVYDESEVFREHALNWRYSVITRASEKVTIVM